jgi:hypothetical protein
VKTSNLYSDLPQGPPGPRSAEPRVNPPGPRYSVHRKNYFTKVIISTVFNCNISDAENEGFYRVFLLYTKILILEALVYAQSSFQKL